MEDLVRKKGENLDTIGEILKEARLQRGLTIGDLQKITKIQRRYLEAIEQNDLDAMPSDYYARTFIRQYSEAVGLNPRPLLRRLDGPPSEETNALTPVIPVRGSRREKHNQPASKRETLRSYIPVFLLLLMVVLIVTTITFALVKDAEQGPIVPKPDKTTFVTDKGDTKTETTDSLKEEASDSSEKEKEEKPKEKKTTLTLQEDLGELVTYEASDMPAPVTLNFKGLDGPAWIGLQEHQSGKIFYQYTLQPGESLDSELPEGMTNFDIVVGAANNLEISVSGVKIYFNKQNPVTGKKVIAVTSKETSSDAASSQN